MGAQDVDGIASGGALRAFTRRLLADLDALEQMLDRGLIESGPRRIGAEQELFLVDHSWSAAPVAGEVLERLGDPGHYAPEIGRFQIEINVDPLVMSGACLSKLQADLDARIARLRGVARALGAEAVMIGILPTLRVGDLRLENLTPRPRYFALNEAINAMRGRAHELHIVGPDELILEDHSVMFESANTSFQVHLQVAPAEFATVYNAAQAVTAPLVAAAANSPLLFGHRLWAETRLALFQQAADTRAPGRDPSRREPRTYFGTGWVRSSPLELFREDAARFRPLLAKAVPGDPREELRRGETPDLAALKLHNGTVYRWNRPCYGTAKGAAHIRIENRVIPSGPTTLDEVANAALWLGATLGVAAEYGEISRRMDFGDAKANFFAAARLGLDAHFAWAGERLSAQQLIVGRLVPLARAALRAHGVDPADVDRYLGVIEARVSSGRNGARWQLGSLTAMEGAGAVGERLAAITAATVAHQWLEPRVPGHEWPDAKLADGGGRARVCSRVEHCVSDDTLAVHPDEPAELVARMMDWRGAGHVAVEDERGRVVGVVCRRTLADAAAGAAAEAAAGRGSEAGGKGDVTVGDVMEPSPAMVAPGTTMAEARATMESHGADCVLVVHDGRLLGIVPGEEL